MNFYSKNMKKFLPILITFFVIFLFYIKRFVVLKFYPPICNLLIFLLFFISLFTKETIIQKFVRLYENNPKESALIYARNLTYVWCAFTFLNLLISIWTIFQSDKIWILYNGCISYILIGTLFVVEYIIRITLRKRGCI